MPFDSPLRKRLLPGEPGRALTGFDLGELDPSDDLGYDGDKSAAERELAGLGEQLAGLQERLFAHRDNPGARSVLVVLQGMDTAGKAGVIRRAIGPLDPQGVRVTAFTTPTPEELRHNFLWRIRRAVPEPGCLGVFDRSHYEDVLIGRVRELAPPEEIESRYEAINEFERTLVDAGTTVVKVLLNVSATEQKRRLLSRLDDPQKHWKFDPSDVDERSRWSDYRQAYSLAVARTHTSYAPWHVVPSDTKWLRNLAVAQLLLEVFEKLDLTWPEADFDVAEQRRRLVEEDPLQ